MSYSKYYPSGWQDGESGATPITAAALNHMEDEVANLSNNPPLLWKVGTYTGTLTSANQWLNTDFNFPSRTGYSRIVVRVSCDTSNAVVTGYDVQSNKVGFRMHRFSDSSTTVAVTFLAAYIKDALQW
jgi:hypothetical protein